MSASKLPLEEACKIHFSGSTAASMARRRRKKWRPWSRTAGVDCRRFLRSRKSTTSPVCGSPHLPRRRGDGRRSQAAGLHERRLHLVQEPDAAARAQLAQALGRSGLPSGSTRSSRPAPQLFRRNQHRTRKGEMRHRLLDAGRFAPEDGSEVSWGRAEASIARDRKKIVPIMLERVTLKAPWNMFHTERMMDWTPLPPTGHGPWLACSKWWDGMSAGPACAEYARAIDDPPALAAWAASYPDDPMAVGDSSQTAQRHNLPCWRIIAAWPRCRHPRAWMLGATLLNVVGAVALLLRVGPDPDGVASYAQFMGPGHFLRRLRHRAVASRALDLGRARCSRSWRGSSATSPRSIRRRWLSP